MAVVDERTLCARFKSWIDAELQATPYGSLTRAENEVHATGTNTRHDLLIYAGNKPVFSCEFKVPTNPQGSSPYDHDVVDNARAKAEAEGLPYFGTFNCASFVLWQVHLPNVPVYNRGIDRWRVVEPQHLTRLDSTEAEKAFKEWLRRLLTVVAAVEAGASPTGQAMQQPEEELVARIEGSLETIVGLTLPDVVERFTTDEAFRRDTKRWMIADQGWQWDDKLRDELLLRTVKVACYLQMNRVLFYSTMRARFEELPELDLGLAKSGRGVAQRLEPRFKQAMKVSQDYETIFDVGYITEVAYVGDAATRAWDGLVRSIEGVDLAGVGLDVLGGIFERLLSPEERHRFGQHYTNPQLVDLLIAAAVGRRDAVVLDPAAGGGTFLVRAYERLRQLGESDHLVLLSQLYGNDVSRFAGHLSTVNLAVRQIGREQNYPRVGTHDFFALDPGSELVMLPLGPGDPPQREAVELPKTVDAVVGNPPYVRRQGIDSALKRRAEQAVEKYGAEHNRTGFKLDGLSDLHVYFWPHATRLLDTGGHLAFLTSSSWLATRYGKQLKQLLLNDYDVLWLAETNAEPWFSDARVKTVAVVARKRARGSDVAADHEVRFVQFRRPLLELLGPATASDRWQRVEDLLDDMQRVQSDDELRVRVAKQASLEADVDWSAPLRASDLYEHFAGLPGVTNICSEVASPEDPYVLTVGPKFGSTWFVVRDVSDTATDSELADWGVTRKQVTGPTARYRIAGREDWRGPVESRYLQRWVRGPGDEPTRTLTREAGDLVITIPRTPGAAEDGQSPRLHPPRRREGHPQGGVCRRPQAVVLHREHRAGQHRLSVLDAVRPQGVGQPRQAQAHHQPERLPRTTQRRAGGRARAAELDLDVRRRAVRRRHRRHRRARALRRSRHVASPARHRPSPSDAEAGRAPDRHLVAARPRGGRAVRTRRQRAAVGHAARAGRARVAHRRHRGPCRSVRARRRAVPLAARVHR